jgi:aminoglycoside phosphotransferase (APT) family kinase protein
VGEEGLLDTGCLERYLRDAAPGLGVRAVTAVTRFPAGLSSLSCRVDALTDDGPLAMVIRAEPVHGVIPPYDIVAEHDLLTRVAAAGLPVPRVLHIEADPAVFGTRFMLMSFVEGEIYRSADPRFETDASLVANLQTRFVETLAAVHAVTDHGRGPFADAAEAARAEVAVCRRRLERTSVLVDPVLEHALDVLDRHAPPGDRVVLLHGDFRLPNLKWRDGRIVGILDWELARLGDPLGDIAFTQTVGMGICSVTGDLLDRYVTLTGADVDERRLTYYHALELTKSTIIGLAAARDLVEGGDDLRLLSVAGLAGSAVPIVGMLEQQISAVEVA